MPKHSFESSTLGNSKYTNVQNGLNYFKKILILLKIKPTVWMIMSTDFKTQISTS